MCCAPEPSGSRRLRAGVVSLDPGSEEERGRRGASASSAGSPPSPACDAGFLSARSVVVCFDAMFLALMKSLPFVN